MGSFLDTPKTEKETERFENERLKCAVSSMQGWRVEMEDAHTIVLDMPQLAGFSFFGVFDGHGGSLVAKHASGRLLKDITTAPEFSGCKTAEDLPAPIVSGFLAFDRETRDLPQIKAGADHSGSTAVTAFVTPTHYVIGNCGDSRCVVARGDGRGVWASEDHKPTLEGERKRIEAAGGHVTMRRVNGDLAVSRALGDYLYKQVASFPQQRQQVSCEPEVTVLKREGKDDYLILACDGIWDVMSNEDCVQFVRQKVKQGETDLGAVCEMICDHCLGLNSRDNMTCMIVQLPGAVLPSPATVEKYKKDKLARAAKMKENEAKA